MVVYLDHAATTPIRAEVLAAYTRALAEQGNPSSVHSQGQAARKTLEDAREQLAAAIRCDRNEVIFTAGGTESDNLAIKGLYWERNREGSRPIVLSSPTEHHAVLDPIEWLEAHEQAKTAWIPVDSQGMPDLEWLQGFVAENGDKIALITTMWVNNETGVIWPIEAITKIAKTVGIPVHSDAVAALGHTEINFGRSGLAAMTVSAHKLGGPVGVGALIVSRATKLTPLFHGGGQERALRSGTMNAPGAKAFALAAALAVQELPHSLLHYEKLAEHTVAGILQAIPSAKFSRGDAPGVPNIVHFTFPGCSGDSLLYLLDRDGVCISNGSACTAGVTAASHVLLAMGRDQGEASSSVRISFSPQTTEADIDALLAAIPAAHAGALKAGYTTS